MFTRRLPACLKPRDTADPVLCQVNNIVQGEAKLYKFLAAVLPAEVPLYKQGNTVTQTQTREELLQDVVDGVRTATMEIRMT